MDELRIHQLTKEMVAEELRQLGDPCATAAGVVRKTLESALANAPAGTEGQRVIEDTVRGAMTALLLAEQSLTKGGMMILQVVLETTYEHVAPQDAMAAALRGLADMRRFVDPDRLDEMRIQIAATYMGAGELFAEYLRTPLPEGGRQPLQR
ncbi:MAG: hypothetical protein HY079_01240 [Elusimicrobia bacterium]|nr:hypothetical protein [Elusimicrobiota bacterium]